MRDAFEWIWAWRLLAGAVVLYILGFVVIYFTTGEVLTTITQIRLPTGITLLIFIVGQILLFLSFGFFANHYVGRRDTISLLMVILIGITFIVTSIGIGILLMFLSYFLVRWGLQRRRGLIP
jgi:hypothetical protein